MNFGRYKDEDWLKLYKRRRAFLLECALSPKCPAKVIENAAILLLEAHHCGPWRMLWKLFRHVLNDRDGLRAVSQVARFHSASSNHERSEEEKQAIEEMVREL